MKKIILTTTLFLIVQHLGAQTTGSTYYYHPGKSKKVVEKKLEDPVYKELDQDIKNASMQKFNSTIKAKLQTDIDSGQVTRKEVAKLYKKNKKQTYISTKRERKLYLDRYVDMLNRKNLTAIDSLSKYSTQTNVNVIATSTSCCDVKLFGLGAANNASVNSLNQNTGNLSLGAALSFTNNPDNSDTIFSKLNTIYCMFNAHAANSADTAVLAKTFLFPEIGQRIFTMGYERNIHNSNMGCFAIIPYAEFSWNKIISTKDSNMTIYTISSTFGCRFQWHAMDVKFGDTSVPFVFSFVPYYNAISVDSKYFATDNNTYNTILGDTHLPPTFHTIGFEAIVQLSSFQLFANVKWVLNDKNVKDSNTDLKGNSFIIGTVVNADFLSFSN